MSMEDMELVGSVTKLLYPEIAKVYHTDNEKVERAIRSAIEVGWERGNADFYEVIFGYSRKNKNRRPTNSEFIVALADLAAIGLGTSITDFKKAGLKPMFYGITIDTLVTLTALVVIWCMGLM